MRIAVLGLGRMGQALAGRLIEAGHEVTVWNRSPQRADELRRSGATLAASPVEAIEPAQVVLTSLADDEAVRAVAFGEQGIERAIGSRVYADTSTVSPALSMELARRFPRFIALPVLGAPQAVRSGAATYLAGGRKEAADELGPVFDALGGRVTRYERAEMAASAKLAVNLLLLSSVVALAESFAVARSGGLDDDQLLSLLADSRWCPLGSRIVSPRSFAGRGRRGGRRRSDRKTPALLAKPRCRPVSSFAWRRSCETVIEKRPSKGSDTTTSLRLRSSMSSLAPQQRRSYPNRVVLAVRFDRGGSGRPARFDPDPVL